MPLTRAECERIAGIGDEILVAAMCNPERPPRIFNQPKHPIFDGVPSIETGREEDQGEDVTDAFEITWHDGGEGRMGRWEATPTREVACTHALSWDGKFFVNATHGQGVPERFRPHDTLTFSVTLPMVVTSS